ncbi:cysteine desulfurase family protein [Parapedomonas caeni]
MTNALTYLDYNATAPVHPAVVDAMAATLTEVGNPSSVHQAGRHARDLVEAARGRLATLLNCLPRQIVFTSGGTEANALALRGLPAARRFVSMVEHESVLANAGDAVRLPVDAAGVVDGEALSAALATAGPGPKLVSIMLANNETGVIQPIAALAARCRAGGAWLHVDAVQALGRISVDVAALGADLLTVSAHKIGGPKGVGALVIANDLLTLTPLYGGGGQELGRRAGTENVPGITGFAAALDALAAMPEWTARAATLRDALEAALMEAGGRVFARAIDRLPTTTAVRMPGVKAETQVMAFDLAGIAVSAGAACSSGKVRVSHVLRAMGLDDASAGETIRISLGWGTTAAEIDRLVAEWRRIAARVARRPAAE